MPQSPSRYVICMLSLQRVICTPCLHAALTKSSFDTLFVDKQFIRFQWHAAGLCRIASFRGLHRADIYCTRLA